MTLLVTPDDLRRAGEEAGLDAVGIAPAEVFRSTRRDLYRRRAQGLHGGMAFTYRNPARSTDPQAELPGARALVVGARSYRAEPPPRPDAPGPIARVARFAWRDHYAVLRRGLEVVAQRLADDGWQTRVVVDDNRLVDREAARRAGLGWYGKATNVLLPGRGSWFVLGSVLTDAPLAADTPVPDGCGTCVRCIEACPTDAIVAPGVLDARRCLAWLLQAPDPIPVELRPAVGDRLYGCDDCQEVCPPNRLDERRMGPAGAPTDATAWVPVLDLLDATDDVLLARHGRWYLPGRDPAVLRRNALIVLGNTADGQDPGVDRALVTSLGDPSALVRGAAVWAARRLGRDDLAARLAHDLEPSVRAELEGEVAVGAVPGGVGSGRPT